MKDLIKNLRTQNNLTLKAFADSIGVSSTAVSNYESTSESHRAHRREPYGWADLR